MARNGAGPVGAGTSPVDTGTTGKSEEDRELDELAGLIASWASFSMRMARKNEAFRQMADLGLTFPQIGALHVLMFEGAMAVSALTDKLSLSISAVSHLVQRLVEARLVKRAESDTDRRQKVVSLSDEGRALMERLLKARLKEFRASVEHLRPELRRELKAVLEKVVDDLAWRSAEMQAQQAGQGPQATEKGSAKSFRGANLAGADLAGQDLSDADFTGANMQDADLSGALAANARFTGANLESADLSGAVLVGATFTSANLEGADLSSTRMQNAKCDAASLEGANLEGADLTGASLCSANLEGANLAGARLVAADFTNANLDGADMDGTDIERARFDGAHLPVGFRFHKINKGKKAKRGEG